LAKVKSLVSRALRGGRVVLHDPAVERSGKALAAIVVVRAVVALGGGASSVELAQKILHALGA
jgi:dTDP-4-amino-4,6-dideoxygalactose transaminase